MRTTTVIRTTLIVAMVAAVAVTARTGTEVGAAADDAVLVDVDALSGRTCGLDDDEGIWCWGVDVAPPDGRFVATDAACGLRSDGTATCWNGTEPPAGTFDAVAGGLDHACAIRSGGDLVCWGGGPGAVGAPTTGTFAQIDAGDDFTCAIDDGDAVHCWGSNDYLQSSSAPAGAFESVSAGLDHACAIDTLGEIVCWGRIDDGRANPPSGTFTHVAAGNRHSCGLRDDRTAACWGYNGSGQALPADGEFVSIGAGDRHSCAVDTAGTPRCWGDRISATAPTTGWSSIDAGDRRACAISIDDGSLECWGSRSTSPPTGSYTSVDVNHYSDACAVRGSGPIVCWGRDYGVAREIDGNFDGVAVGIQFACGLGVDDRVSCWTPEGSLDAPSGTFAEVSAGGSTACGLRTDATLECWSADGPSVWLAPPEGAFTEVAVGFGAACAIRVDASVDCWGNAVPAPTGTFEQLDLGGGTACGLRVDATVVCWGPSQIGAVPTGSFRHVTVDDLTACGLRPGGRRVCWGNVPILDATVYIPPLEFVDGPVAIQPARLVDTRSGSTPGTVDGAGAGIGRIRAGQTLAVDVAGRGGVPVDAGSVFLNVIAIQPDGPGFLTVHACDQPRQQTSNLNYLAGEVVTNATFSAISGLGQVCVYSLATTDLVVDVNGYTPAGNTPVEIRPARLLDTRSVPGYSTVDGLMQGIGRLERNVLHRIPGWGRGDIAGGASAVLVNVTAIDADGPGFVSVFACGFRNDATSSVNYAGGDVVTNLVLAPMNGPDLCVSTLRDTHLVIDAFAYVPAGASPTAMPRHRRLLDTRSGRGIATFDGVGLGQGRQPAGSITRVPVSGRLSEFDGAGGFMLNVIAVEPSGDGFLTVYPCDERRPLASNVNYVRGDVTSNAVLAAVGASGDVCIYTHAETHLVADVAAYLLPD